MQKPENHDLQNRVANSEKQIENLKRFMEELFKRQASWYLFFGFYGGVEKTCEEGIRSLALKKVEKTICSLHEKDTTCIFTCMIVTKAFTLFRKGKV